MWKIVGYILWKHTDELSEPISELLQLPHIKRAYEVLKAVNWSEEDLRVYENQLFQEMDEKGMVEAAKKEGGNAKQLEIARNLKKIGVPLNQIIQATTLSKRSNRKIIKLVIKSHLSKI